MRISSGKLLSIRGNCYLLCKLMHFVYMQLRQSRRIYRLNAHMNAASDNIWNTITGLQVCVCSTSNFCSMKYWGCHTIPQTIASTLLCLAMCQKSTSPWVIRGYPCGSEAAHAGRSHRTDLTSRCVHRKNASNTFCVKRFAFTLQMLVVHRDQQ